ncbi:MAG: rod shape-determining protein MreD [Chitinispirillaceae bacterium]|nr:rod shape-determining protein MreD [Chitinispirillaceae bacterium]
MTRAIFRWSTLFLVCFVLQTTLVPALTVFGVRPDLLMIALFLLAVRTGQMTSVWAGFFLGLAQDLYAPSILGQNALSKAVAGFFAGFFNERVMRLDPLVQMVLLFLMFLVNDALFYLVQAVKSGGGGGIVVQGLLTVTGPRALYSMLFAILPYIKEHFFPSSHRR